MSLHVAHSDLGIMSPASPVTELADPFPVLLERIEPGEHPCAAAVVIGDFCGDQRRGEWRLEFSGIQEFLGHVFIALDMQQLIIYNCGM